jgi:hypothetical protein
LKCLTFAPVMICSAALSICDSISRTPPVTFVRSSDIAYSDKIQ